MAPIPTVDIASSKFKADPFPFYVRLRSEAPVYRTQLPDKRSAWLVTRYDDVLAVLKNDAFGKDKTIAQKAPWLPAIFKPLMRNMLDVDPPDHTRLRGLVQKVFMPSLVENLRPRIQGLTDELLDRAQRKGKMDLVRDYALHIPTTIIAEMLGVPVADRLKFHRWSSAAIASSSSRWGMLMAVPPGVAFLRYIRELVKTRRANPEDDLVSVLVRVEEGGSQLSEDELVAMIFLLLVAEHETTVNLIGNGMLALLKHPDQMTELRENPTLIKSAVEELLRFNGPLETATERYAREEVTVAGITIPRGELVLAVLASANRDEKQFENADRLDLRRDPNPHIAFGHGVHYCLGASLARLEGQIAIATLLRRTPSVKPANPANKLRWKSGLVLRELESLLVVL